MTTWAWMQQGAKPSVKNNGSNNESNEDKDIMDDNRPLISDLLTEHRERIDEFQTQLSKDDLYDKDKHDDLWMLRFLLSHKKDLDKALSAAKETLQFRKKYNLDDKDIRSVPPQDIKEPDGVTSRGFQCFLNNGVPRDAVRLVAPANEKSHAVVVYFSIKDIDTHKLAEVKQEDWVAGMVYANEWQFQWNDYTSRTTGRLTKSIHIIDVSDINLSMRDSTTQEKYAKAGKELQNCYPQGVESYFVCNAPFWIQGPWKLLKPLLPVRVVSKLDFLNPKENEPDRDQILRFLPSSQLPTQFGGVSAH
ncbi:unnamed protein product [Cylindrotheca closterium]|uniref:CRAL-TRIO domain-containing protein n=1 Tax=Cylindrotheca closterium TaxID=2856 RepID=A0AAD2FQU5_9STRA|nr:unnamed protein product [Cylindrotheca closterium]